MTNTATTPMDLFVGLSSVLTGIGQQQLAPNVDPKDIKQLYFDKAKAENPAVFNQLLSIYQTTEGQGPDAVAAAVFANPDTCFLARSIMLAWYLGSWYKPADLQRNSEQKDPRNPPLESTVISADAYTQGWAWNVAQAHPMGYSNFTFGYWSENPPSLADFTKGAQ